MSKISSKTGIVNRDDIQVNPATEERQESVEVLTEYLVQILQKLKSLGVTTSGSNRQLVDINTIIGGALASVTTVSTVSNLGAIGGVNGWALIHNQSKNNFNNFNSSI